MKNTNQGGSIPFIAFPGEESFIVPKKGAYGTPDSQFVNIVAPNQTGGAALDDSTPTGVMTGSAPPLPSVSEVQGYDCDQLSAKYSELQSNSSLWLGSGDTVAITQYNQIFALVNALRQQKCLAPQPPAQDPSYSYPAWSSLDCATATSEVNKLAAHVAGTEWVNPENRAEAERQLSLGRAAMETACSTKPPTSGGGITEPVVPVVPISQLISTMPKFGSSLGGGGGASSSSSQTTKKAQFPWWLLLVVGGLFYLGTRKKKK